MSELWYRPTGTAKPGGHKPTRRDLWYRERPGGVVERTTFTIGSHWMRSVEFLTMSEVRESGICIRVRCAGDTLPYDDDLDVDEGL